MNDLQSFEEMAKAVDDLKGSMLFGGYVETVVDPFAQASFLQAVAAMDMAKAALMAAQYHQARAVAARY